MSKNLNTPGAYVINMVEADISKDIKILENTVRRLAEELGIALKETKYSGISHKKWIKGKKESIEIDYICDFDDFEYFVAEKGDSQMHITNLGGEYRWNLRNYGKKLLESAYQRTENPIEKKMNLWILLAELQNELVPGEISNNSVVALTKSELNLITAQTILKYLS